LLEQTSRPSQPDRLAGIAMKEDAMTYLDVGPMMVALRTAPEEFSLSRSGASLRHIPSRHSFKFKPDGHIEVRARCNCSRLEIRQAQKQELTACFEEWRLHYWAPLQINREFASHFSQRSAVRQFLLDLTDKLHAWLLRTPGVRHRSARSMCPAE
jgi:hypothetical protein